MPHRYEFQERKYPRLWERFYLIYNVVEQRIVTESDDGVLLKRLAGMLNGLRNLGEWMGRSPADDGPSA